MAAWRYRRCLGCEKVFPAGELVFDAAYGATWTDGTKVARKCPRCGRMGYTKDFPVVREVHGEVISHAPFKLPPLPAISCAVCGSPMSSARVRDTCGGMRPCREG